MKSGIERIRELYPNTQSYAECTKTHKKYNWSLIVRKNPMGVVRFPGTTWLGEDRDKRVPMVGLPYTAFFEDLYGIRAGMVCLAAGSLLDGLTRLLRDEFAAASMYARIPPEARQGTKAEVCASIIGIQTKALELYPKALIRAAIALAGEREVDRAMIDRVLTRVA